MRRHRAELAFRLSIGMVALVFGGAWSDAFGIAGPQPGQITPTPGWDTKVSKPTNPNFFRPDYPIAFVKAPIVESVQPQMCRTGSYPFNCTTQFTTCSGTVIPAPRYGAYHMGADVNSASNPDVGNELWIYVPDWGQVYKLFPRPIHLTNGLIDFSPSVGSVVEPSLSEDGTRIYFSYFHDATAAAGAGNETIPKTGADLYAIDITPLLNGDPVPNIDALTVTRLTTRSYVLDGSGHKTPVQTVASRNQDAMNPTVVAATTYAGTEDEYGTIHMHPTEFRTRRGLYLAYVSNKRRLANSNARMLAGNFNFNLHFQPILPDGTLGPEDNQFAYFTTTSALSPTPLREGLAFSYQATTEDARLWHIQKLDSEGRWGPLTGYGHGDQLFHLGSFCVGDPEQPGLMKDYFVGAKYYQTNNEAFGSLWRQDLSILGKNRYTDFIGTHTRGPRQEGAFELTFFPGTWSLSQDLPAPIDSGAGGTGTYTGKLTSPRCGGVNELYFAYSPTSATGNKSDFECSKNIYRSEIGFRGDLKPWKPGRTVANGGHYTVIRRTSADANLLWPLPIVRWLTRSDGDAEQRYTQQPATQLSAHVRPGEPFAMIGTSALDNTDRRPPECYLVPQKFWHPWGAHDITQENDAITQNQDTWTWVTGTTPGAFCTPPLPSEILGVAINVTSNKTNMDNNFGYKTDGGGDSKEAVRLLGVYDVRPQGLQDESFLALIPSHVPIEFQPLDRRYGMKLADVRSWHSLKPRETRTDCGGCHQHDTLGAPISFEGRYADQHPPVDMVRKTPSISYDPFCAIQVDSDDNLAAESYPEWRSDIWGGMKTYCGSCHGLAPLDGGTGTPQARAALYWDPGDLPNGDAVYGRIINASKFASSQRGALGSQLFWAARGGRTDNRNNDHVDMQANYACTSCTDKVRWGFHYSSAHDALPGDAEIDCTDGDPDYANWVFKLGKWIDNHMPRNTGANYGYGFDWYHPTADMALADPDCTTSVGLRIGWWDDTGAVTRIKVKLNDTTTLQDTTGNFPNGNNDDPPSGQPLPLPTVSSSDWITLEVQDAAGNRQIYRKSVEQLMEECVPPHLPGP